MNNVLRYLVTGVGCCLLVACSGGRDFNLPKGNAEQGRATFVLLQCGDCHSVQSIPDGGNSGDVTVDLEWAGQEREDTIHVRLGGETTRVKTYGDLVTSIVNPSHRLSRPLNAGTMTDDDQSKMRRYNDVMSVQELIDLVAFLQSKYTIWIPEHYPYDPFSL
jgi:L-cysteine S-thiosulfotransferase